jgi:serine/threonine protein phosphatase PrpC
MQRWTRDGHDSQTLGHVLVEGDALVASLIAKGEHPKPYAYTDSNEDALHVRRGEQGVIAAVADGHRGWIASAVAVDYWAQWAQSALEAGAWTPESVALGMHATSEAIRTAAATNPRIPESRTTLVGAHATAEGTQWASFGDSNVWTVRDDAEGVRTAYEHNQHEHLFLGWAMSPGETAAGTHWGTAPLSDWLLLFSDGVSEFTPAAEIASCLTEIEPDADAREVVQRLYRLASDHGAGDNVSAVAIARAALLPANGA